MNDGPIEPVAAPEPVSTEGAPTPPEPVVDAPVVESEPPTRQDSIRKAFETLDAEDKAEPAEGDGPNPATDDRPRGPDGKFVAKDGAEPPADGDKAPEPKGDAEKPASALSTPPDRFSADAKAAWEKAPDAIKGEVKRAISELEAGIQQKDAQLAPLKPYFDLAAQHGVEMHDTFDKYVNMERLLTKDMRQGLTAIAQNFGLTFEDMIARATGGETASTDKDRQIVELSNTVQQLQQQVQGVSQSVQQTAETNIQREIEAFAADKPAFAHLENDIAALLTQNPGMSLEDAYEGALANAQSLLAVLNPQPQPAPAPQPRPVRSVTGSPTSGSNPAVHKPSESRSEAVSRAFAKAGLN